MASAEGAGNGSDASKVARRKPRQRSLSGASSTENVSGQDAGAKSLDSTPKPEEQMRGSPTKASGQDISGLFNTMNPRWRDWWIRGFFTLMMFGGFAVVIYMGPAAILLLIFLIQVKCHQEIINVGYLHYKKYNLPWIRTLGWYFLFIGNYYFYGEAVVQHLQGFVKTDGLRFLISYHRFISFCLYTFGIMLFVLSLKKNYYKVQFALFGWNHVTLLMNLVPSSMLMHNVFVGFIWFYLPISMVICNDIFAYIFGFFFGKTKLIKLSPKKTWEGFIGGFFATVVYGFIACELVCHYEYFICPIEYNATTSKYNVSCQPSHIFQLTPYFTAPVYVQKLLRVWPAPVRNTVTTVLGTMGVHLMEGQIWLYPMQWHALAMACFSSLIAPFGGFLASGFKRAFKIKDFGDTIPGHGGIVDRFDCQYLMAMFVNVYIASFIRPGDPSMIVQQILLLKPEEQVQVFLKLGETLRLRGLIEN